jgi:hypothetical protein
MSDQKVDATGASGKVAMPSPPTEKTFENEGGAGPAVEPTAPVSLKEKVDRAMATVKERFTGARK